MHDDNPQVILPPPILSPERAAARLREAERILAEAGFAGVLAEEHLPNVLIRVAPAELVRLQDDALREDLVVRLKALGYTYVAVDITPDDLAPPAPAA